MFWGKSKDFAVKIYQARKSFPKEERFGLVSQLRRILASISSNIAEGSSRTTANGQARLHTIANSSAIEVLNQIIISKELHFMSVKDYIALISDIEEITAMSNRLHRSIQNS